MPPTSINADKPRDSQGLGVGVAGARLTLTSLDTAGLSFNAAADANGFATFANLPSGRYSWTAQASGFQTAGGTASVEPGVSKQVEVLLLTAMVTYDWSVTPTTVKDIYDISLSMTYRTDVLAPALVIDPLLLKLPMSVGQTKSAQYTITNRGLVSAFNVTMTPRNSDNGMEITLPFGSVAELKPGQSVVVPVQVRLVHASESCKSATIGNSYVTPCQAQKDENAGGQSAQAAPVRVQAGGLNPDGTPATDESAKDCLLPPFKCAGDCPESGEGTTPSVEIKLPGGCGDMKIPCDNGQPCPECMACNESTKQCEQQPNCPPQACDRGEACPKCTQCNGQTCQAIPECPKSCANGETCPVCTACDPGTKTCEPADEGGACGGTELCPMVCSVGSCVKDVLMCPPCSVDVQPSEAETMVGGDPIGFAAEPVPADKCTLVSAAWTAGGLGSIEGSGGAATYTPGTTAGDDTITVDATLSDPDGEQSDKSATAKVHIKPCDLKVTALTDPPITAVAGDTLGFSVEVPEGCPSPDPSLVVWEFTGEAGMGSMAFETGLGNYFTPGSEGGEGTLTVSLLPAPPASASRAMRTMAGAAPAGGGTRLASFPIACLKVSLGQPIPAAISYGGMDKGATLTETVIPPKFASYVKIKSTPEKIVDMTVLSGDGYTTILKVKSLDVGCDSDHSQVTISAILNTTPEKVLDSKQLRIMMPTPKAALLPFFGGGALCAGGGIVGNWIVNFASTERTATFTGMPSYVYLGNRGPNGCGVYMTEMIETTKKPIGADNNVSNKMATCNASPTEGCESTLYYYWMIGQSCVIGQFSATAKFSAGKWQICRTDGDCIHE